MKFNDVLNVCCKNKIKVTAINPANETDFPIDDMSLIIIVSELIKNRKSIKETNDIPIE